MGDPYLPFLEILQMLSGDIEATWASGAMTRDHALRLWSLLPTAVPALLDSGRDLIGRFVAGPALLARAQHFPLDDHPWRDRLAEYVERQEDESAGANPHQIALFE